MYLTHFGLKRHPFGPALRPDEMFRSAAQEEADSRIRHLIEMRGIGLPAGEPGVGKTAVCRRVLEDLHSGLHKIGYVAMTTGSVLDTHNAVAAAFGLGFSQSRAAAVGALRAEISRLAGESRRLPVLVLDEAHHLGNDVLAELQMPANYGMDSDSRLCLLLVGLTELRLRLRMAVHRPLAQRVVAACQIPALGRDEVGGYIEHRMRLAGAAAPVFEPPAVEAAALAASRVPRLIDRLAHHALIAAAAARSRTVGADHVGQAAGEVLL